jgi:hypothetical protein
LEGKNRIVVEIRDENTMRMIALVNHGMWSSESARKPACLVLPGGLSPQPQNYDWGFDIYGLSTVRILIAQKTEDLMERCIPSTAGSIPNRIHISKISSKSNRNVSLVSLKFQSKSHQSLNDVSME